MVVVNSTALVVLRIAATSGTRWPLGISRRSIKVDHGADHQHGQTKHSYDSSKNGAAGSVKIIADRHKCHSERDPKKEPERIDHVHVGPPQRTLEGQLEEVLLAVVNKQAVSKQVSPQQHVELIEDD